ncbi:hypothetical protein GOODEAATRI_007757 [Goodea atripinnis]|uniref:Uncharacterized protein n=1 Tax=Goodea atripinnis TaxID=208336 RepID=A0ABV0NW16_9TELE
MNFSNFSPSTPLVLLQAVTVVTRKTDLVVLPNMQGMMGINFGGQMPPGTIPMQIAFLTLLGCPQTGEKSRDDALEAIKGNLDGFSRDAKMHPTPSSQAKKPGTCKHFPFLQFALHLSSPSSTIIHSLTIPPCLCVHFHCLPTLCCQHQFTIFISREALGQIWASANRTTPGMLTKEELYTVLGLIGVAQVITLIATSDPLRMTQGIILYTFLHQTLVKREEEDSVFNRLSACKAP